MISKFLKYNKRQLLFGFKFCAIIFLVFSLILVCIAFLGEKYPPDIKTLFIVVLVSITIAPLFILFIGFLRWLWDDYVINRNLKCTPFDSLVKLGFKKEMIHYNSRWQLTQDILCGVIANFEVQCIVDNNAPKYIQFKFMITDWALTKLQYRQILDELKSENVTFDIDGISKKYHRKKHRLRNIKDLEAELIRLSDFINRKQIETEARP